MLEWVLIYYAITFLFIIWVGVREASAEDESMRSTNANAATAALIVQAVVTVAVWGWTPWFSLAASWLAVTLLWHHSIIHWRSRFEGEACSCAPFQCKDVLNHETWVVACLVAGFVSILRI
jgi:hypothetical protein